VNVLDVDGLVDHWQCGGDRRCVENAIGSDRQINSTTDLPYAAPLHTQTHPSVSIKAVRVSLSEWQGDDEEAFTSGIIKISVVAEIGAEDISTLSGVGGT
jgi:hypothetical protein